MDTVTRLTDFFTPQHYTLSLDLHRRVRTFTGTVTVTGDMATAASDIRLHAKELTIETVLVDGQLAQWQQGDNDELIITQDGLQPGTPHIIVVRFDGKITDAMHGLYPCHYEHAGVKKELLATQFESHHAREVFPCIDEPAAKATFDVTLTTEPTITVLGNMPVKSQDDEGERMVTTFETTPRMSTYLLAFVVGELQKATATTKDGVEVNVWATPAQPAASLAFPLDIAVRVIEFYNDYFGVPYPLPKADHVALPDFSSGAMENWGLITYREIALLADPATTSIASRQYAASVIAHELAHQWFGNLVTMAWWNDLWLNESFATLMSYIAIDGIHPEWETWRDFSLEESIFALRRDALDGVQSVQVDVHHPDEISTLFDGAIVYAKGARLMRMVQHYIGEEAFRKGLTAYFDAFAYENTVGNDLWDKLAVASGKDIKDIMNTWISQSGYPVVTLTRDGDELTLTQEQFFVGPHEPSDKRWPIPLDGNNVEIPELLTDHTQTVPAAGPVQLNIGDTAHFITKYDDVSLAALTKSIADMSLDTIGRIQLLNEAIMLARGGIQPSSALIPLLDAYQNESAEPVWSIISMGLAELRKFVENESDAETALRMLSARIASKQYERLGWEPKSGESEDDTKLRSTIIGLTLYGEDSEVIAEAQRRFESTSIEDIDPELRSLVLSSVARYGDAAVVDELLEAYRSTQSGELRQDICAGITSTRVPEKIDQLLDVIKNPDIVRPQDAARWFVYLIRGRDSRDQAWRWLRENWDWVVEIFGGDKSYDDYPRYSASALVTRQQLTEYKEFFEPMMDVPALTRAISVGTSEIEGRVELIERDKDAVIAALREL